jgi:hypothetical protein
VTVGGRLFTICFAIPGFVLHAFTVQNFTKLIDDNLYTKNVSLIRRVATSLVIVVLWLLIMAAVYSDTEGWEYGDAFYFSYITTTSIGLGDFSPTLTRDWLSSYLLIYVGLVLMTSFIESFIHIFHTSVIHAGTVNLEEKTQDEAKGNSWEKAKQAIPPQAIPPPYIPPPRFHRRWRTLCRHSTGAGEPAVLLLT